MIENARALAAECHDGMVDKYGNPYMEHLERVADRVREMEYDFVDETSEIEMYVATAFCMTSLKIRISPARFWFRHSPSMW